MSDLLYNVGQILTATDTVWFNGRRVMRKGHRCEVRREYPHTVVLRREGQKRTFEIPKPAENLTPLSNALDACTPEDIFPL